MPLEDGIYQWNPNGGCDACDSLEGEHLEIPDRPHPNCDCEVEPKCIPCSGEWDIDVGDMDCTSDPELDHIEFIFTVTCKVGFHEEEYEESLNISIPKYGDPDLQSKAEEAQQELEDFGESLIEKYCMEDDSCCS